jgi:hypothetical protein
LGGKGWVIHIRCNSLHNDDDDGDDCDNENNDGDDDNDHDNDDDDDNDNDNDIYLNKSRLYYFYSTYKPAKKGIKNIYQ